MNSIAQYFTSLLLVLRLAFYEKQLLLIKSKVTEFLIGILRLRNLMSWKSSHN